MVLVVSLLLSTSLSDTNIETAPTELNLRWDEKSSFLEDFIVDHVHLVVLFQDLLQFPLPLFWDILPWVEERSGGGSNLLQCEVVPNLQGQGVEISFQVSLMPFVQAPS